MYKVILIDDEPLARQLVETYLKRFEQFNLVASCNDGFEGFKAIQELKPDLIFLDVQMPRITGFEMLELLDNPPSVIFTTAFDEYAVKAFDANAIDYLLKPIGKERFDKAIQKWLATTTKDELPRRNSLGDKKIIDGYQNRIVVKDIGQIRIIPIGDVYYIEASDDYIKIYAKDGNFLKKNTISQLEGMLDPRQFVRVHRSYIIPVLQLSKIEPYEKDSHVALLRCNAKVPISKTGMAKLKENLGW